ncbi:YgaP family membrane protein [Salimicrobium halophilum]|uniref:Inner membrane protein YgaP-like transmembrane domain-containing protein n=1 Tax=Salimicrobium halophilum TaxID=86666 RepID=A0A1G8UEC4_9BACI|nr:DUF2892 domain-containing protein [Salimicrobium halophilum]SDJ52071.1 Protein of unknown function [Salimicrobium halophilum]
MKNIGTWNSLARITAGLTMLTYAARQEKEPSFLFVLLGSMKVAEGITQYCPMTDAYKQIKDEGTSV